MKICKKLEWNIIQIIENINMNYIINQENNAIEFV